MGGQTGAVIRRKIIRPLEDHLLYRTGWPIISSSADLSERESQKEKMKEKIECGVL